MKRPSTDIPLDVFEAAAVPKAGNGQATANRKKRKILVGETDRIQLGGRTVEDADQYECHYALVAYDPETQIAEIQGAPSVRASRMVKATVSSSTASPASKVIRRKNLDARNVLGEAFGSKKRQQQIRSYERNQVEMDTMGDVVGLVSSVIDDRVANSSVPGWFI
jgi:DNA-directed RNA polymerase I subunit RPA49